MEQWNSSYWFLEPEFFGKKIQSPICLTTGFTRARMKLHQAKMSSISLTSPQWSSAFFGCDKQRHVDVKLSLGRGSGPNPGAQKEIQMRRPSRSPSKATNPTVVQSNESINGPGAALSLHANDAASWKTPWERQDIGMEDKPPSSLLASFTIFCLHIILAINILQNIRRFVIRAFGWLQDGNSKV